MQTLISSQQQIPCFSVTHQINMVSSKLILLCFVVQIVFKIMLYLWTSYFLVNFQLKTHYCLCSSVSQLSVYSFNVSLILFHSTTAEKFATVSLNRMDRIRLIHSEQEVVNAVDNIVRQVWESRGGIQEVLDKRPLCYELKLKGNPWWCYGTNFLFFFSLHYMILLVFTVDATYCVRYWVHS